MNVEKFRSLISDTDWTQNMHLTPGAITSSGSNNGGGGRQGTFTLEDQENKSQSQQQQRPQSALTRGTSPRSSGGAGSSGGHSAAGSRIPAPRSSVERSLSGRLSSASSSSNTAPPSTFHHQGASIQVDSGPGSNGHSSLHDHHAASNLVESDKVFRLKALVKRLSSTLNAVLDADATMRNNLHSLREDVEEIMTQTDDFTLSVVD